MVLLIGDFKADYDNSVCEFIDFKLDSDCSVYELESYKIDDYENTLYNSPNNVDYDLTLLNSNGYDCERCVFNTIGEFILEKLYAVKE
jgi:hypothetical protein